MRQSCKITRKLLELSDFMPFHYRIGQEGPLIRYTGHVRLVGLRLGLFYFVRLSLLSFGPK